MKKILILAAVAVAFSACKKDEPAPTPTPTPTPSANESTYGTVPSDAQGAIYSIRTVTYLSPDDSIDQVGPYMAWFGSSTQTQDVGTVTCNGVELDIKNPFSTVNYPWYIANYSGQGIGNDAAWSVSGSSSFGSWTHNDPAAYPLTRVTNIPTSFNAGQPLTLKFNTDACDGVLVRVADGYGNIKDKTGKSGANDITFTAAEIAAIVEDVDQISVNITTFKYITQTLGGKKIYVVKENVYSAFVGVN